MIRPLKASVAAKMSWASGRTTTRIEDIACSLMGLFEVNMPLLYGEGRNAFTRLQHEKVKISDDESIFAWRDKYILESGAFARSPSAFSRSGGQVSTFGEAAIHCDTSGLSNRASSCAQKESRYRWCKPIQGSTPVRKCNGLGSSCLDRADEYKST